jgi:hypothetical protein
MRRRRRAMVGMALIVAGAFVLVLQANGGNGGGSARSHSPGGAIAAKSPVPPVVPSQISTTVDRLRSLAIDVNPGSGVQFVSPEVGFALSGEPDAEIDDNLSAGPDASSVAWPSPAVLASRDSGRSFTPSLSARDGFWGLDFADPEHGWAVGVTALYRTVDGGSRWLLAGEPSQPLVRVAFADARTGFGLTANGRVVTTTDGGNQWRQTEWRGRGAAICSPAPEEAIVAAQGEWRRSGADSGGGALWVTEDAGGHWTRVAPGFSHIVQLGAWWPDLSCQGRNAVESAQAFCEAACAGAIAPKIRDTVNGGVRWTQIRRTAGWPNGMTGTPPGDNSGVGSTVVLGGDGICLLGAGVASVAIRCLPSSVSRNAEVPRLPFHGLVETAILGGDFVNARTGRVLIAQSTAANTPRQARQRTVMWATDNRGRTWRASYIGPVHPG